MNIETLVNENYLSTTPENIQISAGGSREIKIEYTGEDLSEKIYIKSIKISLIQRVLSLFTCYILALEVF